MQSKVLKSCRTIEDAPSSRVHFWRINLPDIWPLKYMTYPIPIDLSDYPIDPYIYIYIYVCIYIQMRIENRWPIPDIYIYIHTYNYVYWHRLTYPIFKNNMKRKQRRWSTNNPSHIPGGSRMTTYVWLLQPIKKVRLAVLHVDFFI